RSEGRTLQRLHPQESGSARQRIRLGDISYLSVMAINTDASNIKPSDSFSLNIRGSVRSLDADQNGHRSPLKSGSVGQLAPPRSSSRLFLGQLPSQVPPGTDPPSYLWLAVLSCFCPGWPLNICALWYANVSRTVLQTGDAEGARKYGRLSMLLSALAMVLGVAVIIFVASIQYTIQMKGYYVNL
uniref:Trafficking regulator of GLUT4 (SLC2A4) 1b n=1 Tax=Astatotilapia calliptera TaxID=8154 RepID=A0AAX7TCT7_ASTCA